MQFKYYDTLSTLISGTVLLYVLSFVLGWNIGDYNVVILLAIAFVLGYLLNAISALAEKVYYFFMGGKPSEKLLTPPKTNRKCDKRNYTGFDRIQFFEYDKAIRLLKEELNNDKAEPQEMFDKAKSYSSSDDKSRVPDFNAHYAFSRVILTLVIVSSIILMTQYYKIWWAWIISVGIILLAGRRCKERGYYYAKEVLMEYIKAKENN